MIDPARLYEYLQKKGIRFYTGVPDSLMKDFLQYLQDKSGEGEHVITANEGLALSLASGYHFRTGELPLVYLQNSGLGNLINPLSSLADQEMYAVPMLLLIGWRGMPGVQDEPQHKKMGRITTSLLELMEVPYFLLDKDEDAVHNTIQTAISTANELSAPVALLVPEGIFDRYEGKKNSSETYELGREEVIGTLMKYFSGEERVICTTGKTGREFYELNGQMGRKFRHYLLCAGAMGHAAHIALGVSVPEHTTIVLDGDGALLMHMGGLTTMAEQSRGRFFHIVLNNGSHESVGGQPTTGYRARFSDIAAASGYEQTVLIQSRAELLQWLQQAPSAEGLQFVEIRIRQGSRKDLGRPEGSPLQWKRDFMQSIKNQKD